MGLELRRKRDGSFRKHWYGRYDENGKAKVVNLAILVKGDPPFSGKLSDTGNAAFEVSRAKAQKEFERTKAEAQQKGRSEHLTERLIESKTGRKVEYTRLTDLPSKWRGLGREVTPTESWLKWCDTVFQRFSGATPCTFLHEVTPEQAAKYAECLRGSYARRTANGALHILKSAFARFLPLGTQNPFDVGIHKKGKNTEGDTVNRRPFTVDELYALLEKSQSDPFLHPLVVTAACTGMRRGDVCRLKWKEVDLNAGVVSVKTSKTGANVEIPIFQPLCEVLKAALSAREGSAAYVFPKAAQMVDKSPDVLTWRFKKLVASVLPDPGDEGGPNVLRQNDRADIAEILPEVGEAVRTKMAGALCDRVLETLKLYAEGLSVRDIEKRTGRARSSISLDLHRAEAASGKSFMPEASKSGGMKGRVDRVTRDGRKPDGTIKNELNGRARRGSILDWHALRVTWVTLALSAGVPIEVARLVTGHKTVEVVLKHYFKPGREHLRAVLGDKLPEVLTGGKGDVKRLNAGDLTVEELAQKVADKTATPEERRRLAELLSARE